MDRPGLSLSLVAAHLDYRSISPILLPTHRPRLHSFHISRSLLPFLTSHTLSHSLTLPHKPPDFVGKVFHIVFERFDLNHRNTHTTNASPFTSRSFIERHRHSHALLYAYYCRKRTPITTIAQTSATRRTVPSYTSLYCL